MSSLGYNGQPLVVVCAIFLGLTWISCSLRFFVRLKITRSFEMDDWLMVVSQLVFTLSCSFILRGVYDGLGHHNADLSLDEQVNPLMYQSLATITYIANMMFIKCSIAVFLLRIAVKQVYIWILRVSMAVVVIWSVAIFFFQLFQCIPIADQWDPRIADPHCVSEASFAAAAYSISVMSILSDWLYALLPIPMIWSVQMNIQTKATVAFILSLGCFASIATLIRLKYILDAANLSDVLYTGTTPMVWTLVEPGIAITAASIVTIRPLLRACQIPGFSSGGAPSNRGYQNSDFPQLSLRNDLRSGTRATHIRGATELEPQSKFDRWVRRGSRATGLEIEEARSRAADDGSQEHILEGVDAERGTYVMKKTFELTVERRAA